MRPRVKQREAAVSKTSIAFAMKRGKVTGKYGSVALTSRVSARSTWRIAETVRLWTNRNGAAAHQVSCQAVVANDRHRHSRVGHVGHRCCDPAGSPIACTTSLQKQIASERTIDWLSGERMWVKWT
jgi:hypothetical protein